MASSLITGAIMIVLLLVASYVIVGGIITTSETLVKAQYDSSVEISKQVGTDIRLNNSYLINDGYLWIDVFNVGRVPITYPLDLLIVDINGVTEFFSDVTLGEYEFIDTESGRVRATINQGVLDPGEGVPVGIPQHWEPRWAEVITQSGISSSAYLIHNITPIP